MTQVVDFLPSKHEALINSQYCPKCTSICICMTLENIILNFAGDWKFWKITVLLVQLNKN
jgi:hypothetical protein